MSVDAAIAAANKELSESKGEIVVARLGDMKPIAMESLPTGLFSVNRMLGIGGFPRGRIVEIYGPAGHGKTSVALDLGAQTQKNGGEFAFIDAENAFNPEWATHLGVDVSNIIFSQPSSGEQGLEIVKRLAEAGVDLIVVDSVEGLVPRAELDGSFGDANMGVKARLMGQALRGLKDVVSQHRSCVVFTNQIRMKLGILFGNPETTPGGDALKFWASLRLDVRRVKSIEEGEVKNVGIRSRIRVVKSKVGVPFKETEIGIYSGMCDCHPKGIDKGGDLLDVGASTGAIEKSGTWYSFQGERLAQGREGAAIRLTSDADLFNAVSAAIFKQDSGL